MSHTHFVEVCSCGRIITQCRCTTPGKVRITSKVPCSHQPDPQDVSKLGKIYLAMIAQLDACSADAIRGLQNEWREWFAAYGIDITNENIDVAVTVASAMTKNFAEITEAAKNRDRKHPVIVKTLDAMTLMTAILASMREFKEGGTVVRES